jgi:DNA primase catalytic core
VAIHELACRLFRDQLPESWVPGYLADRGFPADMQENWQVGYAPAGRDALIRHLRNAGYQDALIEAAGLARRTRYGLLVDTFRDRAMLPIRSPRGRIVAFIGRAGQPTDPAVPKYLNSPSTPLYRKGDVLFGLWEARSALAAGAPPVLTEGPLDAIAVALASPDYAPVSLCGTALTARQADLLRTGHTEIIVAFDADRSGRRAAVSAYQLLRSGQTTAVVLPPGSDPAQVLDEHGPGVLAAMLSRRQPLADLVVDAEIDRWTRWLGFAEGRIGALRAAAAVVSAMPACDVGRQVGRLAERLGLDNATVTEAVTDALTRSVSSEGRLAGLGLLSWT